MANFTKADAETLFAKIRSDAKELAIFGGVISHDPENSPPSRLSCSIALGAIRPLESSGLAAVSGEVTLMIHVWSLAMQRPLDDIDPEVLGAVSSLMGAFSGGFTLGGTVRDVNVMAMRAEPGYVDFEGKEFRTVVITLPIEINDMWAEAS